VNLFDFKDHAISIIALHVVSSRRLLPITQQAEAQCNTSDDSIKEGYQDTNENEQCSSVVSDGGQLSDNDTIIMWQRRVGRRIRS
jgi:hypothetical protein